MGLDPGIVLLEDDRLIIDLFKVMIPDRKVHNFNSLTDFLELERGSRPKNCGLFFVDLCNERSPEGHETVEALSELKRLYPEAEIIVESGVSDSALMRKCIRNGASRFILKDFLSDEIPLAIDRLEEEKRLRSRIDSEILGRSDVMQNFKRELIRVLSARCGDVLVDGETGTGKELCARALRGHEDRPFVAINVAAIPAELFESEMFGAVKGAFSGAHQSKVGLLESAGNGVLFLDEIQSLDLKHQGKLLRVLETRKFRRVGSTEELPFAARVVSATNQNLPELVSKGLFREDLYYRLSALKLNLPPLRLRGEDIETLAVRFLADASKSIRFSPEALVALRTEYDWPGNIRELRAFTRELAIKSPIPILDASSVREALGSQDLNSFVSSSLSLSDDVFQINTDETFDCNVSRLEKALLEQSLAKNNTKVSREKLGMSRSRFYEKLKFYGILQK